MQISFDVTDEQIKETLKDLIEALPKEKKDEIAEKALIAFVERTASQKISAYSSDSLYRLFNNFDSHISSILRDSEKITAQTDILIEGLMDELPRIVNEAMVLMVSTMFRNNFNRYETTNNNLIDLRTKFEMLSSRLNIY